MNFCETRTSVAALVFAASLATGSSTSLAEEVKIGGLWDITGPVAQFVPPILSASELAVKHVNEHGGLWGGATLTVVLGDSKCDAKEASAAANRLVNLEGVVGVVGALCSGSTIAASNTVMTGRGVPSIALGTSPAITALEDKDLVFRASPSDSFQGVVLADVIKKRGIDRIAVTYIQNDYGKGLAHALRERFEAIGGEVTALDAHEAKKASYRSELANLKNTGAEHLVVIAYAADSGPVILRQSLEGGYFNKFVGVGSMADDEMMEQIGWQNMQDMFLTEPGSAPESPSNTAFESALMEAFPDAVGRPFATNSYDATFLMALALEKAGSADRAAVASALRDVSGPEGEVILPGEWSKAKELIAAGTKINYEGATGPLNFDKNGDVSGVVDVLEVSGNEFVLVEKIVE